MNRTREKSMRKLIDDSGSRSTLCDRPEKTIGNHRGYQGNTGSRASLHRSDGSLDRDAKDYATQLRSNTKLQRTDDSRDFSDLELDRSADKYLSDATLEDGGDGEEGREHGEEREEEEYTESEASLAFTNSSLAYTVSEVELVSGWLEGKSPLALASSRVKQPVGDTQAPPPSSVSHRFAFAEDENKERGNWTGKLDFVLSMLGYAVGLGNIWRFPYLCYRNGGGAFLLPYLLMLFLVGIPLFYLEVSLGQFCSKGAAKCWDFAPLFKGVGVAMIVCSALVSIYYNVIIAWSQFYFFASFTDKLPWAGCDNAEWNTKNCSLKWPLVDCEDGVKMTNGTCYQNKEFQGVWNTSVFERVTGRKRISPSEEYWTHNVLSLSSDLFRPGSPRWHLTLSLFLAWIITFLCLMKGIKTTGKVVYFTALFPYVVLLILFFRGVTLDSAGDGIAFYITPKFHKLGEAKVWRDAANQIFYSLGPCWGGIITLASYNRFHNNALRDTLIVGIGNSLTSLFGGFVIFSYLGHMAAQLNVDIENVVKSGPGLAFIVYPEAVTQLPAPPLWSLAFFFMLILLGLDSQFAMVETLLTGLLDQWPQHRKRKTLIILLLCASMFLLGLPLVTKAGAYLLNLMDTYAASWSLMLIGLAETLAISYVYGCNRFYQDMTLMYGSQPNIWWKICWMALSPLLIVFILVFACVDYSPATYGSYTYSAGGEALGWLMVIASAIWIPACALYKLLKEDEGKTFLQKLRLQTMPNKYWGPALVKHRRLIDYVQDFVLDPEGDKKKLAYINQAFAYSTITLDDRVSMGTGGKSLTTTMSFDGDMMFTSKISLETAAGGVGGTVFSESALGSAGTLLSRVRAPLPAPWPEGGFKSLRSP
ncbi:eukaryotic translation initiation factor 3 subunit f [Plakobranchus ocellatus]|uniref:Transporter n=1 Tax=Plakobranchus ocellatus TaxID=259542 RepID=A0AAV4DIN2_9GAST|nr:eukaryotic translation initiation factor 3 subunit f [Plakobranchus ocellatus]